MSNTHKALSVASDSRPSISDLAEQVPALTTPEEQIDDDTVATNPLIAFNPDADPETSVQRKGVRQADKTDDGVLRVVNQFLDHTRKDGRTNYQALREDGALNITERNISNLCDPEVWKLLREHFAAALIGRGMHKYAQDASYSVNTGSFNINGSRKELLANGNPQPYPRTLRLSITRHADAVQRDRIKSGN